MSEDREEKCIFCDIVSGKAPAHRVYESEHALVILDIHPYTKGLISSMPQLDSKPKSHLPSIAGQVPSPHNYPATCRFANRCDHADEHCVGNAPSLEAYAEGHLVRCFKAGKI